MAKNATYTSEESEFLRSLFRKNPQLYKEQQELRSTWWDRTFSEVEEQQKQNQHNLKTPGYAYYSYAQTDLKCNKT